MNVYVVIRHDGTDNVDKVRVFADRENAIEVCKRWAVWLCDKYSDKPYEEHTMDESPVFLKDEDEGFVDFTDSNGYEHYAICMEREVEE